MVTVLDDKASRSASTTTTRVSDLRVGGTETLRERGHVLLERADLGVEGAKLTVTRLHGGT
jgi:hypothetical protein